MGDDILFQMSADIQSLKGALTELSVMQREVVTNAASSGKNVDDHYGKMAKNVGKAVVAATLGVNGVMSIASAGVARLKAELADLSRFERVVAEGTVGAAQARAAALINRADMPIAEFDERAQAAASAAGMSLASTYPVWGAIRTASGAAAADAQQAVLTETMRLQKIVPDLEAAPFAGRLLDIMNVTGVDDPRTVMGWATQIQGAARLTDPAKTIETLAPVIQALLGRGLTAERSAEFAAAGSQVMLDVEGEKTRTALMNLSKTLGEDILPTRKRGGKGFDYSYLPAGGMEEQIAYLQEWYASASPELQTELRTKLGGKAEASELYRQMLLGDKGRWAPQLAVAAGKIGAPSSGAAAEWEAKIGELTSGPMGEVYGVSRSIDTGVARLRELYPDRAMAGVLRKGLGDVFESVPGMGPTERETALAAFDLKRRAFGDDPRALASTMMSGVISRYGKYMDTGRWTGDQFSDIPNPDYNPDLVEQITSLRAAVNGLTAATEANTKATAGNTAGGDLSALWPSAHTE